MAEAGYTDDAGPSENTMLPQDNSAEAMSKNPDEFMKVLCGDDAPHPAGGGPAHTSNEVPRPAGAQSSAYIHDQYKWVEENDDVSISRQSEALEPAAASEIVAQLLVQPKPSMEVFESVIDRHVSSVDKRVNNNLPTKNRQGYGTCVRLFLVLLFLGIVVLPVAVFIAVVVTLESRHADGLYIAQDFSDLRHDTSYGL